MNFRITGDPQKVEHAKQLVYELIAEKEMQAFQRNPRGPQGFNQDGNSDSAEVKKKKNNFLNYIILNTILSFINILKGGTLFNTLINVPD